MKQKDINLINFLFKVTRAEILDYNKLARVGVGPDAHLIAHLGSNLADILLNCIEKLLDNNRLDGIDVIPYSAVLTQIEFYLNLEYLRGRAGYLVDDNNIHNITYKRAETQIKELKALKPVDLQLLPFKVSALDAMQHEHDSFEIAYLVVKNARTLMKNPDAEIEAKTAFGHGLDRMKMHAQPGGRYQQEAVQAEIVQMCEQCKDFLARSTRKKSTNKLTRDEAKTKKTTHEARMESLQQRFNRLRFGLDDTKQASSSCSRLFMIKVAVATTATVAVGVASLMARTLRN